MHVLATAVAGQAVTYLRWSLPGLPAMLVVLAASLWVGKGLEGLLCRRALLLHLRDRVLLQLIVLS